tara:strand:- start:2760 stop:2981 length:222 start_codon:yes stop_codon:yes gene_type:complete
MKPGDLVILHDWTFYPNHIGTVLNILPADNPHHRPPLGVNNSLASDPDETQVIEVLVNGDIKTLMEYDCKLIL